MKKEKHRSALKYTNNKVKIVNKQNGSDDVCVYVN